TLYDNRARQAAVTELEGGGYEVTLQVEGRKLHADSLGNESEVAMRDLVDIGVFAAHPEGGTRLGSELYLGKHWIGPGAQTITVRVDSLPARAGIDPYNKLIDRNRDDNV